MWGHPSICQSELLKVLAYVCLEKARDSATLDHLILVYKMVINAKLDRALRNKMRLISSITIKFYINVRVFFFVISLITFGAKKAIEVIGL